MTQEEKAKAYDEAVINGSRLWECGEITREDYEYIFPELKESKDERIRKELLDFCKTASAGQTSILVKDKNQWFEWIAWLEKQDEKDKLNTMLDDSLSRETKESWNKFLDEQVEPKFKAGDYIVYRDYVWKVFNISLEKYYELLKINNEVSTCSIEDVDNNAHLWTIDDAKDGDILISGQNIIIFKKFEEDSDCYLVIAYAGIDVNGKLQISNKHWFINSSATPANKEQRELLFFKMKEAGYEWNAEKKELKMIHVIDEGKAKMDYCFTNMMNGEKVSPIWSEEDDIFFKAIVRDIENIKYISENAKSDRINWLKSLKERITWKPSDVQMEMLKEACDKHWEPDGLDPLYMLYQDLIKLKEK